MTSDELDRLMQESLADKTAEPAFFRALLDATVYAHAPREGHSERLSLIQFTTPEGRLVLPFFSDKAQAEAAGGPTVVIVKLKGRRLFELTRGATLMLNPNGINCTLYPEEITALLDLNEVAIVDRFEVNEESLWIGPVSAGHEWLTDLLIPLFANMGCVEAAYMAETAPSATPDRRGLLIAFSAPAKDAEHVIRAAVTEVQLHCQMPERPVDIASFEPGKMPEWLKNAGLEPFYERSLVARFVQSSKRIQ